MKSFVRLAAVAACVMLSALMARADDLSELKAQLQVLQQQMNGFEQQLRTVTEKIEQQESAQLPLPAPAAQPKASAGAVPLAAGSSHAGGG